MTSKAAFYKSYNELFTRASEIIKRDNPCKITDGKCMAGYLTSEGLCCSGCQYLGPTGCTVKSLTCRVWLCWKAEGANEQTYRDLHKVRADSHRDGINGFMRGSAEDHLRVSLREG